MYHGDQMLYDQAFESPLKIIGTFPALGPAIPKPSTLLLGLADYVIIARKHETS